MTDHIHRDLERLCASIERAPEHMPAPVRCSIGQSGSDFDVECSMFSALQSRIHAFQLSRFPGQSLAGKIKHLKKEADEVLADPADVIEHADCLILILGIAKLSGHTVEELLAAANAKMTINEARDWHPPDHDGVYRHKE